MDPSKESLVQQGKKRLAKFQKQRARSGSTTPSSSNSSSQASLHSTSNPSLPISTSNSKSNSRSNSIYLSNTLSLDEGSLYNTPDGGSLENSHNSESNVIATELKQYNASDKNNSRTSQKSESEMHTPLSVGNISASKVEPTSAVDKTSSIESIQSNLAPAHNRSQELSDSVNLNDTPPVDKPPTAVKGTSLTSLLEPSAFSETSSLNEHNPLDEEGTVGKIIPISDSLEENINLDHNTSQSNHEIQHEAHGAETTKGVHDSTQSQVAELTQQLASVKAENQYWSTMITHVSEQNAELLKEKQTLEEQIASLQESERENRQLKDSGKQQGGERDIIEALSKEIERLTSDLNQSRSTISDYENRVKELEFEVGNAQSQIPPPNQINAEAEAVMSLKAEISSLQLQLSTSESDMSYEIQQLNARVQLLQSKCSKQNDTINELRRTLSTKDAKIEELKVSLSDSKLSNSQLTRDNDEKGTKISELETIIREKDGRINGLMNEISSLEIELSESKDLYSESSLKATEVEILRSDLSAQKDQFRDLEIRYESLQQFSAENEAKLESSAQEVQRLSEGLETLQAKVSEYEEMRSAYESLESRFAILKSDNESLVQVHEDYENQLATSRKEVEALRSQLKKFQSKVEIDSLNMTASELSDMAAEKETELEAVKEQLQLLETEKEKSEETIRHLEEQLKLSEEKRLGLDKELQEVDQECKSLEKSVQQKSTERSNLQSSVDSVQTELSELAEQRSKLFDTRSILQGEIESSTNAIAEIQNKLSQLQKETHALEGNLKDQRTVKEQYERDLNQGQSDITALEEEIETMTVRIAQKRQIKSQYESDLNNVEDELSSSQTDLQKLQSELSNVNESKSQYERDIERINDEMAAIKNDLEQSFNRKIDLEGSVNSLNEINEEATQLQARNLELENQLRSVQKRISVTDKELGMLKTKYDDDVGRLTKQTEQLSEELKQKVKQVESLEIFKRKQEAEGNDVRILVETIADVTEQLSNVKNEAKDLRKIKNQFAAFIMKLDKVLDMVQREDIEMVTEEMLEEEDLEGSVNNSAVSENSSTVFNRFIELLSNQRLQLMNLQNVSSLTKCSDDLSNEIQTLKNSCSSLEAIKQSWLRKRDTLTSEINKLESDISELEIALKEATEQVEKERLSLETEQTILKESLDEMEVENKKLRQQIEESKVRLEALEFESEELQQKMELVQDRQKKSGSSAKSSIETDSVMSPSTITDPDMLREMLRSEQDKTAELYIVIEDMKLQLQQRQSHSRPRPSSSAISHAESAEESVHHDSLASDSILDERISSVRDSYIDDSVNYPHANEIEDQADEIVELKSRMAMLQDEIKKRDEELLKKEQMVSRLEKLVFEVSKNNNGSSLRDEEDFQNAQMEFKGMDKSEIEESVVDGLIEAIQMNDETLNQTQEMIQLISPVSGQGSKLPPVESMTLYSPLTIKGSASLQEKLESAKFDIEKEKLINNELSLQNENLRKRISEMQSVMVALERSVETLKTGLAEKQRIVDELKIARDNEDTGNVSGSSFEDEVESTLRKNSQAVEYIDELVRVVAQTPFKATSASNPFASPSHSPSKIPSVSYSQSYSTPTRRSRSRTRSVNRNGSPGYVRFDEATVDAIEDTGRSSLRSPGRELTSHGTVDQNDTSVHMDTLLELLGESEKEVQILRSALEAVTKPDKDLIQSDEANVPPSVLLSHITELRKVWSHETQANKVLVKLLSDMRSHLGRSESSSSQIITSLRKELEDCRNECEELRTVYEKTKQDIQDEKGLLHAQLQDIQKSADKEKKRTEDEYNSMLNDLQHQNNNEKRRLLQKVEELKSREETSTEELKIVKIALAERERDLEIERNGYLTLQKDFEQVEGEMERLKQLEKVFIERENEYQSQVDSFTRKIQEYDSEVQKVKERLVTMAKERNSIQKRNKELEKLVGTLKEVRDSAQSELRAIKDQNEHLRADIELLREIIISERQEHKTKVERFMTATQQLKQHQENATNYESELQQLTAQIHRLSQELNMNKQIQHDRQIEGVESLKEDFKSLREQLLQNGIKGGERRNDDVKRLELEITSLKQEQKKLNANVKKERISVEAHLRLHEDVQRKLEEKDRELRNLILTQSQRRHDLERTDQKHSKEQQIKIMSKEIQYLKAKYRKETGFRADLIYQKKYLLMLIGGLEACEKATWMLITNTGVASGKAVPSSFSNGLTRFRKAVFAVIAIERMSTLRRKWLAQRKLKTETVNSGILNGNVGHSLGMSQLSINQTLHPESYARHSVSTNLDIYDLQKSVINLQSRLNRHNTNSRSTSSNR